MQEILNQLKEWNDNIGSDCNKEWNSEAMRQQNLLASAIGLLESIGENRNIPE